MCGNVIHVFHVAYSAAEWYNGWQKAAADLPRRTGGKAGMDLHELEYFIAIAGEKNLSRAAKKLFVGQPTLSKYLQRLENEWQTPMFSRIENGMQLTYAGERYLYYAKQMLSVSRLMHNEMEEIRCSGKWSLRVGIPPVRCSYLLPRVLPAFHAEYPGIEFSIMEDNSERLDEALREGHLDLSFCGVAREKKEFSYETLREDDMLIVLEKGHPLETRAEETGRLLEGRPLKGLHLSDLSGEVFLLQGTMQRQGQYMRALLEARGIRPAKIQEHSNIRAAFSLAAAGYGAAFLGSGLLPHMEERERTDVYAILDPHPSIRFCAVWKTGRYLPACAHTFIDLVRTAQESPPSSGTWGEEE